MKIVLLVLSLCVFGCYNETSSSAKIAAPAANIEEPPASEEPIEEPIQEPVISQYVKIESASPVSYQIRIERFDNNLGYDVDNAVVISGTTSQQITTIDLSSISYRCRIYLIKQESLNSSKFDILMGSQLYTITISTEYYIHETHLMN